MRKLTVLFAVCSGFSFSASAATICVNPAGSGGCQSTIGAAVTAAVAGDTIKIAAGTYREAVVIPAGKDGLILQGSGARKTIIDPNATADEGLDISSNNVQVIGLGVNNSTTDGIIVNGVDGFTMLKSQVQNASDDCVDLDAGSDDALFQGNRFFGCGSDAVEQEGNNVTYIGNRAVGTDDNGFEAVGTGAVAEKNVCENVSSDCLNISGDGAAAEKNRAVTTDGEVVAVSGNGATITSNRAVESGGVVRVTGDNSVIVRNTSVHGADSPGIEVICPTDCTDTLLEKNRVAATDGGECFSLELTAGGSTVLKNVAQRCVGAGFDVFGTGAATLEGNTVSKCGSPSDDGFRISGGGIKTLTANKASGCGGNGFDLSEAADHVLTGNQAKNNAQNGFLLRTDTNDVTMTGNVATGNGEEGIDNQGDANEFTDNKAANNSAGQDFCDSAANATGTVDNGNDFASTATVCLNE